MKKGAGKSAIAFLWDESFLWGIMAYKALGEAGLPFRLIRAADIGAGGLRDCSALVVPGGWASNKIKALGEPGVSGIRRFVQGRGRVYRFLRRRGTGHEGWNRTPRRTKNTDRPAGAQL